MSHQRYPNSLLPPFLRDDGVTLEDRLRRSEGSDLNVIGNALADILVYLGRGDGINNLTTGTKTLYARTTGNDTTGTGTSTSPYRTIVRMLEALPLELGPDMWILDCTGLGTETLTSTYKFPPFRGPRLNEILAAADFPLWPAAGISNNIVIIAQPTVVQTFTPTSQALDASTSLLTINLTGANWTVNEHRGRIVYGTGLYQVGRVASNTATALEVTAYAAFTGPVTIATESAGLQFNDASSANAGVIAANVTAGINFVGLTLSSTQGVATPLELRSIQGPLNIIGCRLNGGRIWHADNLVEPFILGCYFASGTHLLSSGTNVFMRNCFFLSSEWRLYAGMGNQGQTLVDGCIFDACTPIGHTGNSEVNASYIISNCEARNGSGAGFIYRSGTPCSIKNTRALNNTGAGISATRPGYLNLVTVVGTGNGTYGIVATDGVHVNIDATTLVTGTSGDMTCGTRAARTYVDFRANAPLRNELDVAATGDGSRIFE